MLHFLVARMLHKQDDKRKVVEETGGTTGGKKLQE